MAVNSSGQALFTIEQIELIRRLRNSGITKEQIIQAFDSLERMDNELGPCSNTRTNHGMRHKSPTNSTPAHRPLSQPLLSPQLHLNLMDSGSSEMLEEIVSNSGSNELNFVNVTVPSLSSWRPSASPVQAQTTEEEEDEEMKEFMKKGEETRYEEIKSFVLQYNFTQSQIGMMAGISQSYVSRFLRGDYCDMSDRCCKAMYSWYLSMRKKTTGPLLSIPVTSAECAQNTVTISRPLSYQTDSPSPSADASYGVLQLQRRERFTFRPCHIDVLESNFAQEHYPSADKREEIAHACNMVVTSALNGRELSEREKVHPHIVANWFANRRKELKRIARDEGVDSSVGTGSGGRSRWKSSSADSSRPEPSHLSDDSGRHLSLDEQDDQSLSLAVEAAAVNQAILSLSGQSNPLLIKLEALNSNGISLQANQNAALSNDILEN